MIGQAETGKSKSAAFLLPMIDRIMKLKAKGTYKLQRGQPYALIISSTREMVIQLWEQARKFAHGMMQLILLTMN